MSPKQQRLIKDIASLFVKYHASDWSVVIQLLTSARSEVAQDLERIIAELNEQQQASPSIRTSVHKKAATPKIASRKPLTKRLEALRSALAAKSTFSSSSELRRFAVSLGMKEPLSSQRSEAIDQIISYLIKKPDGRVRELLKAAQSVRPQKTDFDGEFARWAAVILKAE